MESVTVNLLSPLEHNGRRIESLTFEEPTAGTLAAADAVQGDTAKMLAVLAGMCATPLPVLKGLKIRDLNRVVAATAGLLGNEPTPATTGRD